MLHWDTSCLDWKERLLSGRPPIPDLPLFPDEAERALRVFKRLHIPDLIGKPTMGEVAGPWLFPIVEAIFGSYDPLTNRRMIQEFFWLIPKKNTKTSSAAAIMLEALILNRRPEGEFVLIAPTKDVADRSFRQAKGTIKADPALTKLFHVQDHIRKITHRRNDGCLMVQAADTEVVTGGKQVGTLVDELHVLAERGNAADIMTELRGALTARPDGFLIIITTQSKKPPAGIFRTELETARAVRDGLLSRPLLSILYELWPELTKDGGWKDRKYWPLVNPNLGRSVDEDFLVRELESKQREGIAALTLFASQHFNVEIGVGLRTDGWVGAEFWLKNEKTGVSNVDATLTLDELLRRSEVAVVGVDGGGLDDLLGLAVLGRERGTGRWLLWSKAWANRIVLERRKSEASWITDLHDQGLLTLVDAPGPDVEEVANIVMQIDEAGLLPEQGAVGVDSVGISDIVNALCNEERGFDINRIDTVSQGWKLNGAIKTVERKLAAGALQHDGGLLMRKCVGNARTEPKGNAVIVTKAVSGTAKIDPLMALFNASTLMGVNPVAAESTFPEDFEIRVV